MKKRLLLLFITLCMLLCVTPSVGMIFAPSQEPIGNERATPLPSITDPKDGSLNLSYLNDLGDYFSKHFAFRAAAIDTDAKIQSGVFGVSNIDTVIVGTDGWLYYSSTLDDYLGRDTMSDREVADAVHNLSLIRDYVKSQGAYFLFTAPPNKNTLYPEHMPYYDSLKVGSVHNRDLLNAALKESDIPYADLFSLFKDQDKTLYFKRDSHWTNEGALMAYDTILNAAGKAHDDYSSAEIIRRRDFVGDLSKMLYPAGAEAEYNSYYGAEDKYRYVTDTSSVEDPLIITANDSAGGKLYMYRDSFGNALVPFLASAYGEAVFTKGFTMNLESELKKYQPDIFIMELVERNADWLITKPPVLPSPQLSWYKPAAEESAEISVTVQPDEYAPSYLAFRGDVEASAIDKDDIIYLAVTDSAGKTVTYECYGLEGEAGKTGFLAYARGDSYQAKDELKITVIKQHGTEFIPMGSTTVQSGGNHEN